MGQKQSKKSIDGKKINDHDADSYEYNKNEWKWEQKTTA